MPFGLVVGGNPIPETAKSENAERIGCNRLRTRNCISNGTLTSSFSVVFASSSASMTAAFRGRGTTKLG